MAKGGLEIEVLVLVAGRGPRTSEFEGVGGSFLEYAGGSFFVR